MLYIRIAAFVTDNTVDQENFTVVIILQLRPTTKIICVYLYLSCVGAKNTSQSLLRDVDNLRFDDLGCSRINILLVH